jgi:hypothetical protein
MTQEMVGERLFEIMTAEQRAAYVENRDYDLAYKTVCGDLLRCLSQHFHVGRYKVFASLVETST